MLDDNTVHVLCEEAREEEREEIFTKFNRAIDSAIHTIYQEMCFAKRTPWGAKHIPANEEKIMVMAEKRFAILHAELKREFAEPQRRRYEEDDGA